MPYRETLGFRSAGTCRTGMRPTRYNQILTAFRPPTSDNQEDRRAAVTCALLGTPIVRGTGMRGTVAGPEASP